MLQTGHPSEFLADELLVLIIQVGPTTSIQREGRTGPATPEEFVDAFVCRRRLHKSVPHFRPLAVTLRQSFTGSDVGIDFRIESQLLPAPVAESTPAVGPELNFRAVRIPHPSEYIPDQVITQHPIEVVGFKPPHGKLCNRGQHNLWKRPEASLQSFGYSARYRGQASWSTSGSSSRPSRFRCAATTACHGTSVPTRGRSSGRHSSRALNS